MAATKLRVTYADGREVQILASPRAQVETERHFKEQGVAERNKVEAGYHLAWAALHFAGKEAADFESWLDSVSEVEDVTPTVEDEIAQDPTSTGVSPIGFADSASPLNSRSLT